MLGASFLKDDNSNFEILSPNLKFFNKLETNLDENLFGLENKHLIFLNCMTLIVQHCFYQKNDIKRTINYLENGSRALNVRLVRPYAQLFT